MIIMKTDATQEQIDQVVKEIESYGLRADVSKGAYRTVIGPIGDERKIPFDRIAVLPGVREAMMVDTPYKLISREMPDIDLDFEDNRRDEVISYVSQKYGQDHVAQIITFGTLGAKAALRDVGRALGMPYSEVDRVARLVPFAPGMTLARALDENSELRGIYHEDTIIHNLIDSARGVEGVARHASTHAAGVVISKEPLTRYVPLQRTSKDNGETITMTQFAMEDIARIGLLKMDFLGL
ncbi:unnamed protein product, partial [marine sediment metagenome]